MQRKINPQSQVDAVEAFVRDAGGNVKRAQVLELVARLNGAANWNELGRPKRLKPDPVARKMRELLAPFAQREAIQRHWREFEPLARSDADMAVIRALCQVALQPHALVPERYALQTVRHQLETLADYAQQLAGTLRKHLGGNREVPPPNDVPLWSLQTVMMDEEVPWSILLDGDWVEVPDELLEELLRTAVVAEARIDYPEAARYGVPEEATANGCRQWLWEQGFALSTQLDVIGHDSRDDSPMLCDAAVHIPHELVERIRAAAASE